VILHQHRCIFVKVPKTGGTSICRVIGRTEKPHLDIVQIREELKQSLKGEAARVFQDYFKFGFVRNPWDRTVSLYLRREGIQLAGAMTFEEFVGWIRNASDTCIHPSSKKNQLDWFADEEGKVAVDFIGKFENLHADWGKVQERLGLRADLPHLRQSPARTRHYTEYYTPTTRDVIAQKFRVDIEYFGYEYGA
jgi:hypothetical protein